MPLSVAEIGSFHVGGRIVRIEGLPPVEVAFTPDTALLRMPQDGDFDAFQMYVQYVKLDRPKTSVPLLLWHGGSLTGACWESTPDGRPGWQSIFLRAGWNVYVSDAVERGRASWARSPEIYTSSPLFRSKQEARALFRIDGSQFPIENFDQLTKSLVPRWATNDEPTSAAYDELLRRLGRSVIVAHSQGAAFALRAALQRPGALDAIVAVEPSAVPRVSGNELSGVRNVRHLFVWGDRLDAFWRPLAERSRAYHEELRACGVDSTFLELPKAGVAGNSHLAMLDRNSEAVAERVLEWLTRR